jgi:hypothetical protein
MSGSNSAKTIYVYRRIGPIGLPAAIGDEEPPFHPELVRTLAIARGPSNIRLQALAEHRSRNEKRVGDSASTTRSARAAAKATSAGRASLEDVEVGGLTAETSLVAEAAGAAAGVSREAKAAGAVSVRCAYSGGCDKVFFIKDSDMVPGNSNYCAKHAGACSSASDSSAAGRVGGGSAPSIPPHQPAKVGGVLSSSAVPAIGDSQRRGTNSNSNVQIEGFDTSTLGFKQDVTHYDCTAQLIGDGGVENTRLWSLVPPEQRPSDGTARAMLDIEPTISLLTIFNRVREANKVSAKRISFGVTYKSSGAETVVLLPVKVTIPGRPDEIIIATKTNNFNVTVPLVYHPHTDAISVPLTKGKKEMAMSSYMTVLVVEAKRVQGSTLSNVIDTALALSACEALGRLFPDAAIVRLRDDNEALRKSMEDYLIIKEEHAELKRLNDTLTTKNAQLEDALEKSKEKLKTKAIEKKNNTTAQNKKLKELEEVLNDLFIPHFQ